MSSSYPSPPITPSTVRAIDRDLARQNERSPTRNSNNTPLTPPTSPPTNPPTHPPTTPPKNQSVATVKAMTVAAPVDPVHLKKLLGLNNGKCESPTKRKGNPPCKKLIPTNIESQIRSLMTLTQASLELLKQLEMLAELALCEYHTKPEPKAARIAAWEKLFPAGDEKAVPVKKIEDLIKSALGCFPYISKYTCVGVKRDRDSTLCMFGIGGKRVRKGKRTVALIIKPEHYSHDHNLVFLLKVLASNMFCYSHTEQILGRVAEWNSSITTMYRSMPDRPLNNTGLSRKFEGSPAEFWDDADDTSAFATEIEKDRPSSDLACYSLVRKKLMEPLKEQELARGYVYAYGVEGNEGFVKIGFTTQTIEHRSAQWKYECDRVPKVIYPLMPAKKIPHANRVEGLCLAELKYKNVTVICEACPKRHIEWVQVPAAEAIAVIQKWTKFIETAPFTDSKSQLTQWDRHNKTTSWVLSDEEQQRTDDMPKFMQDIAALG